MKAFAICIFAVILLFSYTNLASADSIVYPKPIPDFRTTITRYTTQNSCNAGNPINILVNDQYYTGTVECSYDSSSNSHYLTFNSTCQAGCTGSSYAGQSFTVPPNINEITKISFNSVWVGVLGGPNLGFSGEIRVYRGVRNQQNNTAPASNSARMIGSSPFSIPWSNGAGSSVTATFTNPIPVNLGETIYFEIYSTDNLNTKDHSVLLVPTNNKNNNNNQDAYNAGTAYFDGNVRYRFTNHPDQDLAYTNVYGGNITATTAITAKNSSPVSCTGNCQGTTRDSFVFTGNLQDSESLLKKGDVWVTKTGSSPSWPASYPCPDPNGPQNGWCKLTSISISQSDSKAAASLSTPAWTPPAPDTYYITTNAFSHRNTQCSGNPTVSYPYLNYFTSCGSQDLVTLTITTPDNDAQFVNQTCPLASMYTGQSSPVSITMKNTGTAGWPQTTSANQANGYKLGSQNPQDNNTWGTSRVWVATNTPSGSSYTFSFNALAPSTSGTYPFQWRMLKEGSAWFGNYTPICNVIVTNPIPPSITGLKVSNAGIPAPTSFVGNYGFSGQAPPNGTDWYNSILIDLTNTTRSGSNPISDYYVAFYDKSKPKITSATSSNAFVNAVAAILNADPKAGWMLKFHNSAPLSYFVWDPIVQAFKPITNLGTVISDSANNRLYVARSTSITDPQWLISLHDANTMALRSKAMYTAVFVTDGNPTNELVDFKSDINPTP